FADFDDDGDLDLMATSESTYSGILVNESTKAEGRVSLKVKLPLATPGVVVRLYNEEKKLLGMRQLGLVQSFSSQGPMEAVFGVSPGEYSFEIRNTDGTKSLPRIITGEDNATIEIGREKKTPEAKDDKPANDDEVKGKKD
ncbi:MAG: hypothetical protein QGF00_05100, partial [Planctomycetota bacterium]|nr:hypothetical protein [Planctomycetota bacterium]